MAAKSRTYEARYEGQGGAGEIAGQEGARKEGRVGDGWRERRR
jgi:hypothetical protein